MMIPRVRKLIKEIVSNKEGALSILRGILKQIQDIGGGTIKRDNVEHEKRSRAYILTIRGIGEELENTIDDILEKSKINVSKDNFVLSYSKHKSKEPDLWWFFDEEAPREEVSPKWFLTYKIAVKDGLAEKVSPPRYVYHTSKKDNRESILKQGILAKDFSESYWKGEGPELDYGRPLVFVSKTDKVGELWMGDPSYNRDVWRIDTTKFDADWFEDPNTAHLIDKNELATTSSIPPYAIELVKKV